ncbi:hypothetical protein ACFLSE_09365, partial [Bacteroidota bacterium]
MLISIIFSLLTSIIFSVSQPEFVFEKELIYKADYFTIDQLGYLYVVKNSEVKKIDLKSNQEKNYSNSMFGKIHSVDAADPFRTLLFYKDFNKIEILDKNLTQITSAINLDELGYYNISAVCQSIDGGFWLFDQSLNQLVYVNKSLKTVKKSVQLSEMIDQNTDQEQVFMLEKNDYIYLGIRGEGILLFDNYGTYIKTFPIVNVSKFQVNDETISYHFQGKLFFYNTSYYSEEYIVLPKQTCANAMIVNKKLYI